MYVRLPVSGLQLKFKHKHCQALLDELAQHDRDLQDLAKDPFLTATRLLQVGRAWEQKLTLDEAAEIIDTEKEGGVDFIELNNAMQRAFYGKRVKPLQVHAEDEADEDEAEPAPTDAEATEASPSKKSVRVRGIPLGRVS